MAKVELHIVDVSQHGTTGHIEVNAQIVETLDVQGSEMKGPIETHGIDPLVLETKYGPLSMEKVTELWLADVKALMLDRHERRKRIHSGLHALKGTRV